jgi:hypothetical protein
MDVGAPRLGFEVAKRAHGTLAQFLGVGDMGCGRPGADAVQQIIVKPIGLG